METTYVWELKDPSFSTSSPTSQLCNLELQLHQISVYSPIK